jgi:hypothetical protein
MAYKMILKAFGKALKETMFYCAAVHLTILALRMFSTRDWTLYSLASIFDLKLFFPQIDYGSWLVALATFIPVAGFCLWKWILFARADGK